MAERTSLISRERIDRSILLIRGHKVLLDNELAALYDVQTKRLVEAVKRNIDRFPADFMFQLGKEEFAALRSQSVISNVKTGRGGRRSAPYAFTEQGVAMLSSVLRSPRAIQVNIEIMRALIRLRQMIASHADLARKLEALEKKYDAQFKVVFDTIRRLTAPPGEKKRSIGFHAKRQKHRSAVRRAVGTMFASRARRHGARRTVLPPFFSPPSCLFTASKPSPVYS